MISNYRCSASLVDCKWPDHPVTCKMSRHDKKICMSHGGEARVSAESNSVWFVC